jgi:hypothetical protein
MPSSTPRQAKFMRAIAHGMTPRNGKGPPVAVAKEFMHADEAKKPGGRSKEQVADRKQATDAWASGKGKAP